MLFKWTADIEQIVFVFNGSLENIPFFFSPNTTDETGP